MKTDNPAELAATITKRIAAASQTIIAEELQRFDEEQFLATLRKDTTSELERVTRYLKYTPLATTTEDGGALVTVTNEYLHRNLGIAAGKMKDLRQKLAEDPRVQVHFAGGGQITICYKRPTSAATAGPPVVVAPST